MNAATLSETVILGALSGMRSMSGAAALGLRRGGTMQGATTAMAVAEMLADKTPFVGNRIDPLPLAGRALMGAIVGGVIARDHHTSLFAGSLIGAAAAVIAAHAAFRLRTRVPLSNISAGLIEDAVILGVTSLFARRRTRFT